MNFAVRKRRAPLIIIVSLVDILIILLIFFVVSTTFKKDQPEVQINLPESKTAQKKPSELEHAIVSIDQDDQIKLDGRAVGVGELEGAVRDLPDARKSTLALQGDKKASFGTIIKGMDALKLEGGTIEFEAGGLLARAIQHEHDHLHGILFIDRMRSAAKAALSSRLRRLQKEARRGRRILPEQERPLVTETTL